jgi:hypothetical protein
MREAGGVERGVARELKSLNGVGVSLAGVQRIKSKALNAVGRIWEYAAFDTGGGGEVCGCFAATYSTVFGFHFSEMMKTASRLGRVP